MKRTNAKPKLSPYRRQQLRIECLERSNDAANGQVTELRKSLDAERLRGSRLAHDCLQEVKEKLQLQNRLDLVRELSDTRLRELQALKARTLVQVISAWWRGL